MTDPLTWSPINLGRWAGTQVRVHFFLIIYLATELLGAAVAKDHPVPQTACWLLLLLLALSIALAWVINSGVSQTLGNQFN